VQMYFRRDPQNGLDQRSGNSGQVVETTFEFVADQKPDGDLLEPLRRKKETDPRVFVFAASRTAPKRNREHTNQVLHQVRIRSQSVGSRCLALRAYRGATIQRQNVVRRIC